LQTGIEHRAAFTLGSGPNFYLTIFYISHVTDLEPTFVRKEFAFLQRLVDRFELLFKWHDVQAPLMSIQSPYSGP